MPPWTSRLWRWPSSRRPACTLVFVHIPKTAGMSLREVLLAGTAGLPSLRIHTPVDGYERLAAMPVEERRGLGLVEGHLYYGIHELLPRPSAYVTMVREPVERVLSFYSYVQQWEPHHLRPQVVGEGLSLGECIRRGLTVELDNFMVRCLTGLHNVNVPFGGVTRSMLDEARAHLDSFAAVGITEEFEASIDDLCGVMGWRRPQAPVVNVSEKRMRREELGRGDLDLVIERNALDTELYEYARRLVMRRRSHAEAQSTQSDSTERKNRE